MPYATQLLMTNRFGSAEVIAITDRAGTGAINTAVLTDALDQASVEIDGYLAGRYTLPLPSVPRLLEGICCDIARYRLSGAEAQETDAIRNRYRDAIKMLEALRDGKMSIGLDGLNQPVQSGGAVLINAPGRTFSADTLGDY